MGREEIVDAVKRLAREHADGELDLGSIDAGAISSRLYTSELPDPDLVIRTSGERAVEFPTLANRILLSSTSQTFTGPLSPDRTCTGR